MMASSQKVAASSQPLGLVAGTQPLGLASLFPDDDNDNDDIEVIDGGRAVIDVVANNNGGAAVLHAPAMPAGRQLDGGDAPPRTPGHNHNASMKIQTQQLKSRGGGGIAPLAFASGKTRNDDDPDSDSDGEEEEMVPAFDVMSKVERLVAFKGFVLFALFLISFMTYATVRADWQYGYRTYLFLETARQQVDVPKFDTLTTTAELAKFFAKDVSMMRIRLNSICENCLFAKSIITKDLTHMSMREFLCTDFNSEKGVRYYDVRDCDAVDAEFAANPDPSRAPCCANTTLVQASEASHAYSTTAPEFLQPDFLSPGPVTLTDLLDIDEMIVSGRYKYANMPQWKVDVFDRVLAKLNEADVTPQRLEASARNTTNSWDNDVTENVGEYLYVTQAVDNAELGMIIVSRNQRMIGAELKADWVDRESSRRLVDSKMVYWSFNFNTLRRGKNGEYAALVSMVFILFVLSFVHEMFTIFSSTATLRALPMRLYNDPTLPLYLLTTLLPIFAEIIRADLKISEYMLFTAMIMVVCTVRLFEEGEVLYPFHLAIATIRLASRTLLRVLFLTLVLSVSLTMVYGLLFGMTDDTLSIERGVAKMFHMLWAPASLNPEYVKQSAAGAYVLYYFCLFVMRLIFGSLFIAIIVGSFNTARKEIHKSLASDVLREAGYRYVIKHSSVENRIIGGKVVRQTFMMSDRVWVLYMMTWYAFGGFLPIVYRNLIRMKASNCGLGKGKDGLCVLYTKREMDEFLGMKTSRALLAVFRVERNNGSRSKRYSWWRSVESAGNLGIATAAFEAGRDEETGDGGVGVGVGVSKSSNDSRSYDNGRPS